MRHWEGELVPVKPGDIVEVVVKTTMTTEVADVRYFDEVWKITGQIEAGLGIDYRDADTCPMVHLLDAPGAKIDVVRQEHIRSVVATDRPAPRAPYEDAEIGDTVTAHVHHSHCVDAYYAGILVSRKTVAGSRDVFVVQESNGAQHLLNVCWITGVKKRFPKEE